MRINSVMSSSKMLSLLIQTEARGLILILMGGNTLARAQSNKHPKKKHGKVN